MSVTRGTFLKTLGRSLPGMVLGSGVAVTAQKWMAKMAAVMDETAPPSGQPTPAPQKPETPKNDYIRSGPTSGTRVALTFDDGPNPGVTDRILDELKQRQLHATFFMIGQRIVAEPDLARRVLAEGHAIGNHTFTHPDLTKLTHLEVAVELDRTQDLIATTLGQKPIWFRPPYGNFRPDQLPLAQDRGLRVVMWNVDTRDWSEPGEEQILAAALNIPKAGSIILCHDLNVQTANCVGRILDGLLERGLAPVSMDVLMG